MALDQNLAVDARSWIELAAQRKESTYPQTRAISLLDTSGTYIAPFFLEPDYNLSPGYMERGGSERGGSGTPTHAPWNQSRHASHSIMKRWSS